MRLRLIFALACCACRPQEVQVAVALVADPRAGGDDFRSGDVTGGDLREGDPPGDIGPIKKADGQPCSNAGDCTSGSCADGVCCAGACDGSCETCNGDTPGSCTLRTADDNVECVACNRCDGTHASCQAETGVDGNACAAPCSACSAGSCVTRLPDDNVECPACNRCDGTSTTCQPQSGLGGNGCDTTCTWCVTGSCVTRIADDNVECAACKRCDGTSTASQAAECPLLPTGLVWHYLDDGSDQGTTWQAAGFDDSGWLSGPGQLGYGDGDEATVVSYGPDAANKYVTTYFRTTFTVAYPLDYSSLRLRVIRDDGVIVYVNGVEVLRDCMPAGTVTSATWAACVLSAPEETTLYEYSVSNPLVAGTNTLAAEVHQGNATSSDVSFELDLSGTP